MKKWVEFGHAYADSKVLGDYDRSLLAFQLFRMTRICEGSLFRYRLHPLDQEQHLRQKLFQPLLKN